MDRVVDYYFVPVSPWTYLGHARFVALAAEHRATVRAKPCDLGRVFTASGGLPLAQRPAARRSYRLVELARFRDALGIPLVVEPKHFPVPADAASRSIIAADLLAGGDAAVALTGALLRAVWVEERDLSDAATLAAIATACGLDAEAIGREAASEGAAQILEANTDEAIAAEVFGAPTYVPRFGPAQDQRFWGQDRLDLLARALAS